MPEATPFGLAYAQHASDPSGSELVDQVASGWLREYIDYGLQVTDAPPVFHLAVGLSVLATAAGSRIQFHGGGNRQHWPNLYVLFVAPSGLMRKSTSIDLGMGILRKCGPDLVLPNETSREEFLRVFSKNPECIMRESEFASALARYSRDYMGGMKQLLTDLWDCTPEYRRDIKGSQGTGEKLIIKRPCLNYLAASTVEWLIESLNENDIKSGFLARFLIFPSATEGQWVSFFADVEEGVEDHLARFVASIRHLGETQVDFRGVYKPFNAWSQEMKKLAKIGPPEMQGFYSRMAIFTAKICSLIVVSECGPRDYYEVEREQYDRAIVLMEWLRSKYEELLEQKLVFSKEERVMQRILDTIRKDGKIEWRSALRQSHMKTGDFERYLSTLLQRGDMRVVTESPRGRPLKMIYIQDAHQASLGHSAGPNGTSPVTQPGTELGRIRDTIGTTL